MPGGSILMTSAPKSDSTVAAAGAAMKLAQSRTFSPSKMPFSIAGVAPLSRFSCSLPLFPRTGIAPAGGPIHAFDPCCVPMQRLIRNSPRTQRQSGRSPHRTKLSTLLITSLSRSSTAALNLALFSPQLRKPRADRRKRAPSPLTSTRGVNVMRGDHKRGIRMSSARFAVLASLALVALCWQPARATAGDLEDCMGLVPDKVEVACTAILGDAQRPAEDRVKAYFSRSRFFTSHGKFDAGLADAEAALQLNPQSIGALVSRAYVRQRSGKPDLALSDYNRAVELDPKNPSVLTSRGFLRADQKAFPEALADFSQAIALRQDFAQAYVGRGRVYVETGQLDQALGDFNAALAMNATVQSGFFWRGQVYRRKGDVDRAIDDFSRAIAQAPQIERGAYYARAELFMTKGDYARAIADFDRLLSFMPDNKQVQQQRQAAVAMQAELAKVRDTPAAQPAPAATVSPQMRAIVGVPAPTPAPPMRAPAIVGVPATPASNQLLAQAVQLIGQRKFVEALTPLNQVLGADPANEAALRLRALSLIVRGRYADARADADTLLKVKPNDSPALSSRAMASIGLRQFDQAIADASHAIEIDPKNAQAHLARGMGYRLTGKWTE